ncbi:MAG: hypothetical protein ABGZ35_05140 [Planctomycetaceae bacterium]|jgi:hypothetical protein
MSAPIPDGQAIRLDTHHTIQNLMSSAVSRINSEIRVEFRDDQVVLRGVTESWHEKQLAQESLRSVSQSYVIHNEISVAAWT